jgi:LPXTG-motif cell wall-anchored protein
MRVARPLYEALPYVYVVIGVAAIAGSFVWRVADWSWTLAVAGLVVLVGGLVLLLRRRDYRIQKRHYGAAFEDEE